jgi:diguanylate cyclase (GGDEF)-like protein/PAS domain S-box-containing protein/putative nucleotidyltransferase with HDIG domain
MSDVATLLPTHAAPNIAASSDARALLRQLDAVAAETGQASTEAAQASQAHAQQLVQARLGVAGSLYVALQCKHPATAAHCLRVALHCSSWAAALKMPEKLRLQLEVAALLHDVGKIGVPDGVLNKPQRLAPEEVELIDRHRDCAAQILSAAGAPKSIVDAIHAAAAWYDGSHRNVKLSGANIPAVSRMLSIVDAYDAMTTDQVFRPARSRERAIAELFQYAGSQFDPDLVKNFAELFSQDQSRLQADVARRWLGLLANAQPTTPWNVTLGALPTGAVAHATAPVFDRAAAFEKKLLENMRDAVIFVDTQAAILQWNTGAERMTGVAATAAMGRTWAPSLLDLASSEGKMVPDAECPLQRVIASGVQHFERVSLLGRSGRHVDADLQITPVTDSHSSLIGATILLHDASSEASLEEKCQVLHAEMTKDPLTQVANRAEFDRMLAAFVEAHTETNLTCSLIMADIDHFKRINDNYGHQAGDEAIVSFAGLLKSMCRSGDLVARYGGEEFAVLCADCNNAAAARRAELMRKALSELPLAELGGNSCTASFGCTELQTGDTPETMLRRSDRALLMAKQQGRNQVVQLGEGMEEEGPVKRSWFKLPNWGGSALVDATLVTKVPMDIAIEKLRGFIADHNAKIVKTKENEIRLEASDKAVGGAKRANDREITFLLEIKFAQQHVDFANTAGLAAGKMVQTVATVTIRPKKDRDRRVGFVAERARFMLGSLKSYLMARETDLEPALSK